MIETMKIYKCQTNYLQEKIDKFNKRTRKLNCPDMTLTFGEESAREWRNGYGHKMVDHYIEATIDYEIPNIDGWKLIPFFNAYNSIRSMAIA